MRGNNHLIAIVGREGTPVVHPRKRFGQRSIGTRFAVEAPAFRRVPVPFVAEATTFVTVSPRALVRLEGAVYSVPCRWAGLDLIARVGATTITIAAHTL